MNPHDRQPDSDWEKLLDRQLRALPDRRAPDTLLPRVMAALRVRALPWYQRTWWTWPRPLQCLSLLLVSVVLGVITWLALHAGDVALTGQVGRQLGNWFAPVAALWTAVGVLVNALGAVIRSLGTLNLCLAGAVLLAMYLSCVGLGTVFYRVAFYRRNS